MEKFKRRWENAKEGSLVAYQRRDGTIVYIKKLTKEEITRKAQKILKTQTKEEVFDEVSKILKV